MNRRTSIPAPDPKRTALHERHVARGGRMVEFAGWSMPVQYDGVLKEHERVRRHVGVFDVGHMGQLFLRGPGAEATLDHLATNHVARMQDGQALYTPLCNPRGGVRDDVLVYRLDSARWMLVVNAANTDKIRDWVREHLAAATEFEDRTEEIALVAVQGPGSRTALQSSAQLEGLGAQLESLPYYRFVRDGAEPGEDGVLVSRTGYTGELGYEIYCGASRARRLWDELLDQGGGIGPAGLAARDTLRFEVGYCLYGHELEEDISPLEAGIGWTVKLKKSRFIGREALLKQKANGVPRTLVGLEIEARAIARQGYAVVSDGAVVGRVTSGTFAPTLQKSLALAIVDTASAGAPLQVRIRGSATPARRVPLPFYRAPAA